LSGIFSRKVWGYQRYHKKSLRIPEGSPEVLRIQEGSPEGLRIPEGSSEGLRIPEGSPEAVNGKTCNKYNGCKIKRTNG
jgi:hypothetical protein